MSSLCAIICTNGFAGKRRVGNVAQSFLRCGPLLLGELQMLAGNGILISDVAGER